MLTFASDPKIAEQQMNAIIFYMTAFGYIDGRFDREEKSFVRGYIEVLVKARADAAMPGVLTPQKQEIVARFVRHFHEVFEAEDRSINALFSEAVASGEQVSSFVLGKLKLRCYEIFHTFDTANQRALLATVDELIHADGELHAEEAKFRSELEALLGAEIPLSEADLELAAAAVEIAPSVPRRPRIENHPFFTNFEQHYSADPRIIREQAASDLKLMEQFIGQLGSQRRHGAGRLTGATHISAFDGQTPFLDGHVYVHPAAAAARYELTVLGDLHGCYSCLKAALLQADFFAKLEAWRADRERPEPKLILLGDYIDRGMFSYNGVLRTIMQLYLSAPDHVFVLRGNHEYYIEYQGRVYGGVKPAEAINSLYEHMPPGVFEAYMRLFEQLPNTLFFDRTLFVHAGIPRDEDIRTKYKDLASLNDPELRFQMLWSDPSSADYVPDALQAQNARFPFGRLQFDAFMQKLGCTMMVRGHEKVDEGFRSVYPDNPIVLLNLFSAGGADNSDLPEGSSYRVVTPMACTIFVEDGQTRISPWEIQYKRFNDPVRNRFFASSPEIEHKAE